MRLRSQSGEGRIGFFFWLFVFAFAVLAGYRVVPVKIKDAQLADYTVELAQFRNHLQPEQIATDIFNKARELGVPLEKKAIKVEKFRELIRMSYSYEVPLDFIVHTHVWKIEKKIERPLFAAL